MSVGGRSLDQRSGPSQTGPGLRAGPLRGGRPVGIPQHGVEGPGKVIGLSAAVVLHGGGQQAGQEQQQQKQQLEGQRRPDHPREEGAWGTRAVGVGGAGHPADTGGPG